MRNGRSFLILIPLGLIAASAAMAQPALPPVPPPAGGMTLDTFLNRQMGRIMAADTDGDGRVSRAEMAALSAQAAAKTGGDGGRDPNRAFDAMDSNHDGYLDKDEVRAALTRRFQRMDANGDGIVTPDERMAGRMRRQPGKAAEPADAPQP